MNAVSLWGTFSVADHLRSRPFVADVLLYDRLIVPVPDGEEEFARWRARNRNPDLQQELLEIVGELGVPIPWSTERAAEWARRYSESPGPAADAVVRDDVAQVVAEEGKAIAASRAAAAYAGALDPDDPAFMLTRQVLADEFGSRKDRALLARIPRADEVEAVVAYGSYDDFSSERGSVVNEVTPSGEPVFTFEWSFFVPSSSRRSDRDLLREAVEIYGSTELGVDTVLMPEDQMRKPGSCGKPAPGVEIMLVGADGNRVTGTGPDHPGEVFVRSANTFDAYHKNTAAYQASSREGFHTVGDIGYWDDEGYLYICDRKTDMIISGGMNIYPAEIEAALEQHPGIYEAAVFGIPSEQWGEAVHATVVRSPGSSLTPEEIIAFAREHLARYKVPRSVDFAEELPRTGSGKLLKRQLRAPYWAGRTVQVG